MNGEVIATELTDQYQAHYREMNGMLVRVSLVPGALFCLIEIVTVEAGHSSSASQIYLRHGHAVRGFPRLTSTFYSTQIIGTMSREKTLWVGYGSTESHP